MSSISLPHFIIAAILPLLLERMSRQADGAVKLRALSKMLFILLGVYITTSYAHEVLEGKIESIYLLISYRSLAAIVSVLAVLKLSPLATEISKLIMLPQHGRNPGLFCLIISFLAYGGACILWGIQSHPEKILATTENMIILQSVIEKPVLVIPALVFTIFLTAVGEELVFRYVAISALKSKFTDLVVVVSSAAIWSLFHTHVSMHLFVVGIFFGYLFLRTQSLSLNIVLHFIYNVAVSSQIFYFYLLKTETMGA